LRGPGEVLSYLETYNRLLEGACIPEENLFSSPAVGLCRAIRNLGLKVKVDTNGSLPEALGRLLQDGIVDYVAVDIKARLARSGCFPAPGRRGVLVQSVEARCACSGAPACLTNSEHGCPRPPRAEDLLAIGRWLQDGARFVLQQFRPGRTLIRAFRP